MGLSTKSRTQNVGDGAGEHSEQDDAVARLKQRWTGRASQIDRIVSILGTPHSSAPSVLITGQHSAGKTAVLRDVFASSDVPHAYVSCVECSTPRSLFDTILNQLFEHSPSESNAYSSHTKCRDLSTFMDVLHEMDHPKIDSIRNEEQGIAAPPAHRRVTKYIIFDNAERLRALDATLLQALLRMDQLSGSNVCTILVTAVSREQLEGMLCTRPFVRVHFDDYTKEEVARILEGSLPASADADNYRECVKMVMNVFWGQSKNLQELRQMLSDLYLKYVSCVKEAGGQDSAKLFKLLKPALRTASARTFLRDFCNTGMLENDGKGDDARCVVDVELPYHSKHLLVAAYLAAHSPPSRDTATFSLTLAGPMRRKKKGGALMHPARRKNAKGDDAAGARAFSLERMLAIFYSIMIEQVHPTSQILSQVAGLAAMGLITPVRGDEMAKFRCNAAPMLVKAVGDMIHIDVDKYVFCPS